MVIVSKNPAINIKDIQKLYDFKKIIFDSSNSFRNIEKWKKECGEINIHFYSVPDSGAYIEEL